MLPSTNGKNGRDKLGRFAQGNAGGPGNPYARRVAELRSALMDAVTEDDLRAVVAKLKKAKEGDIAAIREVLDRALGKPLAGAEVRLDIHSDLPPVTIPSEIIEELLSESDYLDYLRDRALKEDAAGSDSQ